MFPRHIVFELTYRCNYRCKFCYCADNKATRELSVDEWGRIARELRGCGGASEITLTGGEPFLYPDLAVLLKELRNLGVESRNVFTNVSLIDEEKIELLKRFATAVHVSLSGRMMYRELTGSTCGYDFVLERIDRCVKNGLFTCVSSVLTSENFQEMESVADDCFSVGVPCIQFGYVMCEGAAAKNRSLLLNWRQRVEVLRKLDALRKKYPQKRILFADEVKCRCRNGAMRFMSRLCGRRCTMGRESMVISPDGYMRPCIHESNRRPVLMFSPEQKNMFAAVMAGGTLW